MRAVQRQHGDIGLADRAPRPHPVAPDRSAELAAVVEDLLIVVGGLVRDAGGLQLVGHVGRFHLVVVEVAAQAPMKLVGAALDDEVQSHAAGAGLDVVARGGDLDLVEVVVVEIRGRSAGSGHVSHLDAIERPRRVLRPRSLRLEVRLLAGFVAADVDAIDEHARHAAHQRERIARRRDLLQLVGREVRRRAGRLRVHDRRLARDGDRFFHRRHFHRNGWQLGRGANANFDVLAYGGREALHGDRDLVGAGGEIQKAELACIVGRRRERPIAPGQRDGHAWKHATLFIGNRPRDGAGAELLGDSRRCGDEREQRSEKHTRHVSSFRPAGPDVGSERFDRGCGGAADVPAGRTVPTAGKT